ncbi:PGA18-like protein [Mya arenaria]|uniref:PGA18-like protein n=1 Tax=Mya arenaria TaxID=6604 RepID=A0ABY7E348_MYAAR|nr:PGA18-like protein [Mya arenaria]
MAKTFVKDLSQMLFEEYKGPVSTEELKRLGSLCCTEVPDISSNVVTSLQEEITGLDRRTDLMKEEDEKFDWLPSLSVLLNLATGSLSVVRVLKMLFKMSEADVNNCLEKNKPVRAGKLMAILKNFLSYGHLKLKKTKFQGKEGSHYGTVTSALCSMYVDLALVRSSRVASKKSYGREVCGFVCFVQPDTEHLLEQARSVPAGAEFVSWLSDECSKALESLPVEDRKFRKGRVTRFLLEEASDELTANLYEAVGGSPRKQKAPILLKSLEEMEGIVDVDQDGSASPQTFVLDPSLISKHVHDPDDQNFFKTSEIVSITSIESNFGSDTEHDGDQIDGDMNYSDDGIVDQYREPEDKSSKKGSEKNERDLIDVKDVKLGSNDLKGEVNMLIKSGKDILAYDSIGEGSEREKESLKYDIIEVSSVADTSLSSVDTHQVKSVVRKVSPKKHDNVNVQDVEMERDSSPSVICEDSEEELKLEIGTDDDETIHESSVENFDVEVVPQDVETSIPSLGETNTVQESGIVKSPNHSNDSHAIKRNPNGSDSPVRKSPRKSRKLDISSELESSAMSSSITSFNTEEADITVKLAGSKGSDSEIDMFSDSPALSEKKLKNKKNKASKSLDETYEVQELHADKDDVFEQLHKSNQQNIASDGTDDEGEVKGNTGRSKSTEEIFEIVDEIQEKLKTPNLRSVHRKENDESMFTESSAESNEVVSLHSDEESDECTEDQMIKSKEMKKMVAQISEDTESKQETTKKNTSSPKSVRKTPQKGDGKTPKKSEGKTPKISEGKTPKKSEGTTPNKSEGKKLSKSEGIPIKSDGKTPKKSEGKTPNKSEGKTQKNSEGTTPNKSEGKTPNKSDGQIPNTSEGKTPNRFDGKTPNRSDGKTPNRSDGKTPNRCDVKTPNRSEGKTPNESDGKTPKKSDVKTPKQSEGKTPKRSEGKTPKKSETISNENVKQDKLEDRTEKSLIKSPKFNETEDLEIKLRKHEKATKSSVELNDVISLPTDTDSDDELVFKNTPKKVLKESANIDEDDEFEHNIKKGRKTPQKHDKKTPKKSESKTPKQQVRKTPKMSDGKTPKSENNQAENVDDSLQDFVNEGEHESNSLKSNSLKSKSPKMHQKLEKETAKHLIDHAGKSPNNLSEKKNETGKQNEETTDNESDFESVIVVEKKKNQTPKDKNSLSRTKTPDKMLIESMPQSDSDCIPSSQKKRKSSANIEVAKSVINILDDSESESDIPVVPDIGKHIKSPVKNEDKTNKSPFAKEKGTKMSPKAKQTNVEEEKTTELQLDENKEEVSPAKRSRRSIKTKSQAEPLKESDIDSDASVATRATRQRSTKKQTPVEKSEPVSTAKGKAVKRRVSLSKGQEALSDTDLTDQSDFETRSTRRRSTVASKMTVIKEKEELPKQMSASQPEPGTPKTRPPRKLSSSTSKKMTQKVENLRGTRKRRLSGELSEQSVGSTDSEVSFPKMKKVPAAAADKKQATVTAEKKPASRRLSAPPTKGSDSETASSKRYSLRKK